MILDVRKSSTIKKDTASLEIFYMDLSGDYFAATSSFS